MRSFSIVSAFALTASASASLVINEVRSDQTGADNDEYFEIYGDANQSLAGYAFIVIGDGTPGSGTVESVTLLDAFSCGSNGIFVGIESTFTMAIDPAASFAAFGTTGLNFENTDNVTFMLVQGFTGALNADIDTNNDGVIDNVLWGSVIDSVSFIVTPGGGDAYYGASIVGPDGTYAPAHAYRDWSGAWTMGSIALGPNDTPGALSVPAPGALALLGLAGLAASRRRA